MGVIFGFLHHCILVGTYCDHLNETITVPTRYVFMQKITKIVLNYFMSAIIPLVLNLFLWNFLKTVLDSYTQNVTGFVQVDCIHVWLGLNDFRRLITTKEVSLHTLLIFLHIHSVRYDTIFFFFFLSQKV